MIALNWTNTDWRKHMILIHKLVNGKIETSYEFADKKSVGAEYKKFQERLEIGRAHV